MKKNPKPTSDREFSVILEKVFGEIKILGENMKSLRAKVDAIFEEVGKQKEEIAVIKVDLRIIKGDIADIKVLLSDHGSRLTALEAKS